MCFRLDEKLGNIFDSKPDSKGIESDPIDNRLYSSYVRYESVQLGTARPNLNSIKPPRPDLVKTCNFLLWLHHYLSLMKPLFLINVLRRKKARQVKSGGGI